MRLFGIKPHNHLKPYIPLSKVMNPQSSDATPVAQIKPLHNRLEFNDNKIKAFESFILTSVEKGIKLFIVISPVYGGYLEENISLNTINKTLKKYNVEFWDYSKHSEFVNNSELFADRLHLNSDGAKLFSEIVADRINKYNDVNRRVISNSSRALR